MLNEQSYVVKRIYPSVLPSYFLTVLPFSLKSTIKKAGRIMPFIPPGSTYLCFIDNEKTSSLINSINPNKKKEVIMNTLKFAFIVALIACTMVSFANADGLKSKPKPIKVVNLTIEKALQNPGLVAAMCQQLDKDDFLNNLQHTYFAEVSYNGTLYRITGTLAQWVRFFKLSVEPTFNTKSKSIRIN
jgi:hypothetical protein